MACPCVTGVTGRVGTAAGRGRVSDARRLPLGSWRLSDPFGFKYRLFVIKVAAGKIRWGKFSVDYK